MTNKFRERILSKGKKSKARLILPEINDKRIKQASLELESIGFKLVYNNDFIDRLDYYIEHINTLSFTKNWPLENMKKYLMNQMQLKI